MRTAPTINFLPFLKCLTILGGFLCVSDAQCQVDRDQVIRGHELSREGLSRRVQSPNWKPSDAEEVFFDDAFRDALYGTRPLNMVIGTNPATVLPASNPARNPLTTVHDSGWSTIISAETIEDEIKVLTQQLNQTVTTPTKFANRGYVDARIQFSILGMLFAIADEYDGEIRWRSYAATARDRFLHVASIAEVGTVEVYAAAKNRKTELNQLVRGGSIDTAQSNAGDSWPRMLDRGPLMERLETAHQESIEPALASAATLRTASDRLIHEGELIAAIGSVLTRDGMEGANDEEYVEYCVQLKRAAGDMIQAVKQNDYDAARGAAGEISKSCSNCHEAYRG